ncbi:MAG: hypothetical protein AB7E72_16435 [Lysobacterales bacterium]
MQTSRRYPSIESPCPASFSMARDQKSRWCEHCQRTVHNLDALDRRELLKLGSAVTPLCVSYSVRVPVAVLLATGSAAALAAAGEGLAPDITDEESAVMEMVEVGGIGVQREAWESLFQELEVPDSLQITDARPAGGDQEPQP